MGYGYLSVVTLQDPAGKKKLAIIEAQNLYSFLNWKNKWSGNEYYTNAGKYFNTAVLQVTSDDLHYFGCHFVDGNCSVYHNISRDSLVTIFRASKKDMHRPEFRCLVKEPIDHNVLIGESETVIGLARPMN